MFQIEDKPCYDWMDAREGCLIGRLDYCVDHWPLNQLQKLEAFIFAEK